MSFDFILNIVDGLSLGSDLGGTGIDIHLKQVLYSRLLICRPEKNTRKQFPTKLTKIKNSSSSH